jgi:DNA-directed RNA polymerase subunit delta
LSKKRLVKNYDTLPEDILQAVKAKYPTGYEQHLITYRDKDNKIVSALPFETEDIYYLIRMTVQEAKRLVRDADDIEDDSLMRTAAADIGDLDVENEFDGDGEDDDDLSNDDDESDHIIVTRRRGSDEDLDDIADSSDY